ncbi:hypothetical protein DXG01_016130 [Tephrocybe rancida]|nr:hypothetical protein DXG01_016130 [Tephrocybe rancida]
MLRLVIDFTSVRSAQLFPSMIPVLRMSNLVHFEIKAKELFNIPASILNLASLTRLRSVTLPRYSITRTVIAALSNLPALESINSNDTGPNLGAPLAGPLPRVFNIFRRNAFPRLKAMTVSGSPDVVLSILGQPNFPSKLDSIHLEIIDDPNETEISNSWSILGRTCPALRHFSFRDMRRVRNLHEFELESLLSSHLTTLKLTFDTSIYLDNFQIAQFAHDIPSIEYLWINHFPTKVEDAQLPSPEILCIFATKCPKLKHLGVLFDPSTAGVVGRYDITPFAVLEELDVGKSTLRWEDVEELVVLFSRILPRNARLICPESGPWNSVQSTLRILNRVLSMMP